jgi:hypothetical protein
MSDDNHIKIPREIIETMIILCDEIKDDIEHISINGELNNGASAHSNIKFSNNLIMQYLNNYLNNN